MAGINFRRAGLAGLAVGLFLNITESVFNMAIVAREQAEAMKALHLPEITGGAIGFYVAWGFVQGLLTVWLYAAIRPRLGPGPRTAVVAGLVVWSLAYAFPALGNAVTGLAPWPLSLKILAWSVVEAPLAAILGAWLYQET
jgi:hypothetical protein